MLTRVGELRYRIVPASEPDTSWCVARCGRMWDPHGRGMSGSVQVIPIENFVMQIIDYLSVNVSGSLV